MIVKISLRNIFRNKKNSLLIIIFMTFICAFFITGYSIIDTVQSGLKNSFKNSITGDMVIAANSDESFGLLGSNTPVIGELFLVPTLKNHSAILEKTQELPEIDSTVSQISGAAALDISGKRYPVSFFGIDFNDHFSFFPELILESGRFPGFGEHGIMLSKQMLSRIESERGRKLDTGDELKLTSLGSAGFKIRQLELIGVYSYAQSNSLMEPIVLIDAQSARKLNSILITQTDMDIPEENTDLLDIDFDSMFFHDDSSAGSFDNDDANVFSMLNSMSQSAEARPPENDDGSWQFIIVNLRPGVSYNAAKKAIAHSLRDFDIRLLDWKQASGQSAIFGWYMQILFYVGLIVAIVTGCIGIVNMILASMFTRYNEIGLIRSIGGQKILIIRLLLYEYIALSLVGYCVGVIAARIIAFLINHGNISFSNEILRSMFGGSVIRYMLTFKAVAITLVLALLLGVISSLYPVFKASSVQPASAISRGPL